jgi:choline dehydrogenase-like flavoprotein
VPENPNYVIVGSGPSGIAAAVALVRRGHQVTIVDVGDELEEERAAVVSRMSQQSVEQWSPEDINEISGTRRQTNDAVHSKQTYGSSFSFAPGESEPRIKWLRKQGFHHSHARGGLSNVWGAAMLPFRQEDIADWPIEIRDLEEHYRAVMEFVPCTAAGGTLEDILPSYSTASAALRPSVQAADLSKQMESCAEGLSGVGIRFGKSRLAIRAEATNGQMGCQYCALCLSGCPYKLIHSSAHTLRELIDSGKVTYLGKHFVENFHHDGDEVVVSGKKLDHGGKFSLRATRLFVAAGVIPTAALVLASLGAYGKQLTLRDSQYFIYPLLKFWKTPDVDSERMHTSAQLFMEIDDPAISAHLVHIQIYGYSAFLREELERTFLRWPLRNRIFRREFLGRLMVAQGFLHSTHSGTVHLELKRDADGTSHLECETRRTFSTRAKVFRVGLKLLLQAFRTMAIPLIPAVKIPSPGSSYHCGGSFPMSQSPGEFETDTLGRLPGHPRVHIVDASVLPSIPATTVSFSLMANAHRIASLAQALRSE